MKGSDFISVVIALGFLLMYFLSSKLDQHYEAVFACFIICVLISIHKNFGPKV